MHNELKLATSDLAHFLQEQLPELSEDWWKKHVIERLSFQQQRLMGEKRISSLRELDFAALLRILDQNWYELSEKCAFPREARNWVKELQTVRNKWAHMPAEEAPASEVYRDADTLGRLLALIVANNQTVNAVRITKEAALSRMAHSAGTRDFKGENETNKTEAQGISPAHLFKVGEVVVLRSDLTVMLPVLELIMGGPEVRYCVFQNGSKVTYYESQLQSLAVSASEGPLISIDEFRARLTALYLLSPSTANLFSLRSGRVNFVPYQYRPVLKLIRSDRPRLLIADEVGVGKTIEASLVLKELRARMDISSVLVICPKALVAERKWQTELKRFDESFTHLDGAMLRHCLHETDLEGEWPEQYEKAIVPFSLFDSNLIFGSAKKKRHKDRGLLALDPAPVFDLVIVDEAHHIRNSDTFLHQGVRYFCDNARAVLLMTATPVQLGSEDLFTLLNVLRPDLVIDRNSFQLMAEPNRFINEAVRLCRGKGPDWPREAAEQLQKATQTEWGRLFLREGPTFQAVFDKLHNEAVIPDEERIALTRTLEEFYTFSSIINRTRRRDIGEFTSRKPQTLTVDFTNNQKALHDDLLGVVARILARCHGQQSVKFMMTTIRRQAASCLYGLAPLLSGILNRKLDQLELIESADSSDEIDLSFVEGIRLEIEGLITRAENLDPTDPKVEAFIGVLIDKTKLENNKALVFSTFRHTLAYLAGHTSAAGMRYGLIHGDVPDDERASLRKRFSLHKDDPSALDVLLSSEVGCEGLDFQFCDFLVNYDLPWNPMRIEQRIGRIDRYGQKSETVSVVNLVTPGTVDADIYQRCLMRIGVFQHAVGGSEEILGQITQEIHDIAESFVLTDEERSIRLQQLADNGIRRIREELELEEKETELFGLNVPKASWREDIEDAENEWLSPEAIQQCVAMYLKMRTGTEHDHFLGDKQTKTLRLSQEARSALLADFRLLKRSTDPISKQWEKWLKGGNPSIAVTFDQDTATDDPSLTHLTVLHPLVRQAASYLETRDAMQCTIKVSDVLPVGSHRFALYRWRKFGIKPDEELVTVADNPAVEVALRSILHTATEPIEPHYAPSHDYDDLDALHHAKWAVAQANHIAQNQELAEHRVQSLTMSHHARVRALVHQISKATDEKIRIMKQSELARANADFDRRIAELSDLGNTGDIRAAPVMFGTVVGG
jgi:ATP-dependent helicase HepA